MRLYVYMKCDMVICKATCDIYNSITVSLVNYESNIHTTVKMTTYEGIVTAYPLFELYYTNNILNDTVESSNPNLGWGVIYT